MDTEAILELQAIEDRLEKELLGKCSKHAIEELQRKIAKHFVRRFIGKRKKPKYGNISKCFTDSEIKAFFSACDSEKMRLLYLFMSQIGLRIGEAVKINIKDLNLESRELLIKTEKEGVGVVDSLLVPIDLFNATLDFVKANQGEIEKAQGYIFFKQKGKSKTREPYLEKNGVRNYFRGTCEKAGLSEVYSVSDESTGRSVRHLHRLSTHSLRHYAITRFAKQSNGNLILTSRFARHREPSTTMTYIAKDKTSLYETIEQTSALSEVISLKSRVR